MNKLSQMNLFPFTLHANFARKDSLSQTDYLCDSVSETLYFNDMTENELFVKLLKEHLFVWIYDNISCKVFKQMIRLFETLTFGIFLIIC